jgi:hypothetical protein
MMFDTDTLERELHAVKLTRRDYKSAQSALNSGPPDAFDEMLVRIEQAYQRYTVALQALGERVAGLVEQDALQPRR